MVLAATGFAFAAALLVTANSVHRMLVASIQTRFQRDEMARYVHQAHEMLEARAVDRTSELASKHDESSKESIEREKGEAALRESEQRFRATFEQAAVGLCHVSPYGRFLRVNQKLCDILGYTADHLLSLTFQEITHPDDLDTDLDFVARVLADEIKTYSMEKRYVRRDGSLLWANLTVSLTREPSGAPKYFISVVEDISYRKSAEQALRDSEERYRSLVEESFDGIFVQRGPTIVFANSRLCEMLGYSETELVAQDHWKIYHTDYQELTRSRAQARMRGESVPSKYEVRLQRKDGSPFDGEINARVVTVEGQPGVQVWIKDVTERKQAELSLKESEERYRELFDNSADLIYTHDLDGNFTSVNKAVERILGYTPQEFLNLNFRHIVDPDYLALTEENFRSKVNGHADRTGPYQVLLRTKDGQPRWLEVNSRIMIRDGSRIGVHGTARDISDRKLVEDQLKQEREFTDAILRSVPGLLYLFDEEGRMVRWNKQLEELPGYSAEEVARMRLSDWFGGREPDTSLTAQRFQDVLTKGRAAGEANLITKDGTAIPFYFTGVKLTIAGKPYMTGIGIDITERKRAEEELKKSRAMISSVLNSIPQSIFWKDRDSVYLGCNEVFARAVGLESSDEIVCKTDYDLPWPRHEADAYRADDQEVMTLKQAKRHIIEPLQQADGTRLWVDTTKIPLTEENGSVYGVLGVYDDITERKKTEDAIKSIVEGVSGEIGEKFFESSVRHFAKILDADLTLIGEISQREEGAVVRTIAFSDDGELQDNFEYELKGAPCEEATKKGMCSYLRGVAGLFPQDKTMRRRGVEAYVGVGLYDSRGQPMGIMAAMYLNPLENVKFAEAVLRIFASRAAAEIERKRAEEALRDSEATLRTVLQAAPIGIGQVGEDRTLGWTNQLLCTMLGYSREELAGQNASILYGSEEQSLRVEREKHPYVIGHETESVETRFQRKDGAAFDVLVSSSSVVPGDPSHGTVFTAMDITERKRSEQQLKRLGAAVESAGEAIVVTDSAGSIIYVNPTFEETTGYSRQEVLGQNPRILKSDKHGRAFYREMWDTLLGGRVWRGRFTNRRKDGTLYEETATISPIRDQNGRIVNYVAVKRDVTGETTLQKQLFHAQKMEAIGTLAGGIAHDFNNLLQAILGYSDLLLMKKGPRDLDRKRLEVIQHAARDGAALVSRILTFSRKAESRTRPIDLNAEIRKAQELLRRTVPRMIEIKLMLAEDLQIIDADPAQVEQVLLNLAVNAQHAMPDGGQLLIETSNVSLSDEYFRTHLGAKPGHYVLLTVSDTGVGVEPDVLDRMFEPFFTTKTNGEGTGLGLAMVHGIVSQHGGYIRCYSEPGRGTSFKIYLPVSRTESLPSLAETREMPAFGTETILIVDDDDRIRDISQQMIEMGGYKVLTAPSGEEALKIYRLRKNEISLVILDLIMPGMGGKRCLRELLRIDPDVRVLVASGFSSNDLTFDEKEAGARGFVSKPYDAKDVLGAIRNVLDKGHL